MAKCIKKYYAVRKGIKPGIYESWEECREQTSGFSSAEFKSFRSFEEAREFIEDGNYRSDVKLEALNEVLCAEKAYKNRAEAYVDGSYDIKTKRFSCGVVLLIDGTEKHFSKAYDDEELAEMRNVAGEIKGAETAIRYCTDNEIYSVTVYHDYEGIAKWCRGEWKTNRKGTKAYREFCDEAAQKININFIKVKSHSGDKYNDLADKLAKDALFSEKK